MTIELDRPCTCRGLNPKCSRCDGYGFLQAEGPAPADGIPLPAYDKALRVREQAKAELMLQRKLEEVAVQQQNDLAIKRETKRQELEGLYRCLKCSYPQNRDPTLKCAMCGSTGPYVSRLVEYDRLLAQETS